MTITKAFAVALAALGGGLGIGLLGSKAAEELGVIQVQQVLSLRFPLFWQRYRGSVILTFSFSSKEERFIIYLLSR